MHCLCSSHTWVPHTECLTRSLRLLHWWAAQTLWLHKPPCVGVGEEVVVTAVLDAAGWHNPLQQNRHKVVETRRVVQADHEGTSPEQFNAAVWRTIWTKCYSLRDLVICRRRSVLLKWPVHIVSLTAALNHSEEVHFTVRMGTGAWWHRPVPMSPSLLWKVYLISEAVNVVELVYVVISSKDSSMFCVVSMCRSALQALHSGTSLALVSVWGPVTHIPPFCVWQSHQALY